MLPSCCGHAVLYHHFPSCTYRTWKSDANIKLLDINNSKLSNTKGILLMTYSSMPLSGSWAIEEAGPAVNAS